MKRFLVMLICLLSVGAVWAERDDAAPLCVPVDFPAETYFESGTIDGLAFKVLSQKGPYFRAEDVTLYPCWGVSVQDVAHYICPNEFSPVVVSSRPGDGDETVWLAWVAAYRIGDEGVEYGPWSPCLDYEYPDNSGNPDAIFAWHKPICLTADMPCCGNPDCEILP